MPTLLLQRFIDLHPPNSRLTHDVRVLFCLMGNQGFDAKGAVHGEQSVVEVGWVRWPSGIDHFEQIAKGVRTMNLKYLIHV